MQCFHLKVEAF